MKKIFLQLAIASILSLINATNYAQTPTWNWAQSAGGSNNDIINCIAHDAAGNIYATGFFQSDTLHIGNFNLPTAGYFDIFIAKYDAAGNVLWAKSAGGAESDVAVSIAVDASGNSYITGSFQSDTLKIGNLALANPNQVLNQAIFFAKYDPSGNLLWASATGGGMSDRGNSVAVDDVGNIYLAGSFQSSSITFGNTVLSNSGGGSSDDIFIVKYRPSGSAIWAHSATGSSYGWDHVNCLATDPGCSVYITGYFSGEFLTFGNHTLSSDASGDIYVAKYDSSGNALWANIAGGTLNEWGNALATDSQDNVYLTGAFSSPTINFGNITLTNSYQGGSSRLEFFIAGYDGSGNVKWAESAGQTDHEEGLGITTDSNGNVYVSGRFDGPSITFGSHTLTGTLDFFLVKYDSLGNAKWAEGAGSKSFEAAQTVTADDYGHVYVAGQFYSPSIVIGTTTLTNSGVPNSAEIFIAKMVVDLSIGIQPAGLSIENQPVIFPNPAQDRILVSIPGILNPVNLSIYNALGEKLFTKQSSVFVNTEIDISKFAEGIYFLRIECKERARVRKFVKL